MRWPWKRRVIPPPPDIEDTREEAQEAIQEEELREHEIEKRQEVVNVLSRQLRNIRAENNYVRIIRKAYGP